MNKLINFWLWLNHDNFFVMIICVLAFGSMFEHCNYKYDDICYIFGCH